MTVTATFSPATVSSPPGNAAALTLHLRNDAEVEEVVKLKALGELAEHTVLQSETIYLEPGEAFEVPVIVDVSDSLISGHHTSGIQVSTGDGSTVMAEATIAVDEVSAYAVDLFPSASTSSSAGKHRVSIDNTGNMPIMVELAAQTTDSSTEVELAATMINVDPGKQAKVELKVHARNKFWSGEPQRHPFQVRVVGSDHVTHELDGVFEQGPRLRPWLLPALLGAGLALLLGTLAWFLLLEPAVESIADERAALANEAEQAALDDKIAELEAAAEEARSLPLGQPADLRLNAEASPGGVTTESFTVASDRVLSATDVVFQNPGGAVGRIALLRSGEVLLESELANFRDLDLHFVAPFRFDGGDTVEVRVECVTPGPSAATCVVGASVIGFVDQTE